MSKYIVKGPTCPKCDGKGKRVAFSIHAVRGQQHSMGMVDCIYCQGQGWWNKNYVPYVPPRRFTKEYEQVATRPVQNKKSKTG